MERDDRRFENQPHSDKQAEHHREKRAISDQTSTSDQPMPIPRLKRSRQKPSYLVKRRPEAEKERIR
jgi:hypothetical protein